MISSRKKTQDFIRIPDEMEKLKTIATVNVVMVLGKKKGLHRAGFIFEIK